MAVAKESVTLESLLEWEPDSSEDGEILERVKRLAELYLPDGWRQWKVVTHSRAELLGEVFDSQILKKIRFSLLTVELARAFCPDCTSLPEKVYKDIKIKMLEWPFCVGLIIGPPSIGARIRGSAVQNELIVASLTELKPLLLSRKDASSSSKSKKPRRMSRMDKLEEEFGDMKDMFSNFMKRFEPISDNESEPEESYAFSEDELQNSQSLHKSETVKWKAPDLPLEEEEDDDPDFIPQTKKQ
ncbi:unnamed protein product [Parnassius apollo]|uniref:(apollo) hypothetical protein n=1 Tax=Parnassius apollo TaxID=110799 RepID=A0A8S3YDN9_PARAO|nr:unnamed protein product [Parnassius apollo]